MLTVSNIMGNSIGKQRVKLKSMTLDTLENTISHISNTICCHNPKSAYSINSFPPTSYLPAMMITRSHIFLTERGYNAGHKPIFIR